MSGTFAEAGFITTGWFGSDEGLEHQAKQLKALPQGQQEQQQQQQQSRSGGWQFIEYNVAQLHLTNG